MSPWVQAALAGAGAAAAWGLLEPLDRRVLRFPYSDIALLGRLATRGPRWKPVGWALHLTNGAVAGLVFRAIYDWIGGSVVGLAVAFALAEHVLTYPLTLVTDRFHPARGAPELPPLARSPRAFAQATWRHLVFGVALGLLVSL
ncbi:MAG: hypothetical protein ACXWZP_04840 [Gaiellaceae bacterium]